MLDLTLHCNAEEGEEVHHENGPKDGDVEGIKECTNYSNEGTFGDREPKLELGQSSDERSELFV